MDKILVVDDNIQNCDILADVLEAWGYKVYKAFQGMEAYRAALNHRPDLIILDVMLPGMNGFEVCKKIKNNNLTRDIPVIMLTVLTETEDRIRGFNVGADMFLSKPINYNELKNRVISLIKNKRIYEGMENQKQIVESFLEIIKLKDDKLYLHTIKVKDYCKKMARILLLSQQQLFRLLLGASLHDIGKIFSEGKEHIDLGEQIIRPLKLSSWAVPFIRNHHERMDGHGYPDGLTQNNMPLELQVLIIVNRFIELWEEYDDKNKAVTKLNEEMKCGWWNKRVTEALQQVIEDEKFLEGVYNNWCY